MHILIPAIVCLMLGLSQRPAQAATGGADSSATVNGQVPAPGAPGQLMLAQGGLPPGVHGKRAGPAEVAPVVMDHLRFGVIHFGKEEGLDQNGGYIVATDLKTGEKLWTLKVYANTTNPDLEADVQEVFISKLKKTGHLLQVTDEKGRRYLVDPKTRSVQPG